MPIMMPPFRALILGDRERRNTPVLALEFVPGLTLQVIDLGPRGAEDAASGGAAMLAVAFAGTFAASLEAPVRARLGIPCEVVVADEAGIVGKLGGVDVLVTMAFTRE